MTIGFVALDLPHPSARLPWGNSVADRFVARILVDPFSGCALWRGSKTPKGYGHLRVGKDIKIAHRLAWELFRGPIPAGLHVLHRCDNSQCVRPDHLFLGTNADNVADKVSKGRQAKGDILRPTKPRPHAKLTPESVYAIRAAVGPQTKIAKEFGVCQMTVSDIKARKRWGWLQ